MKSTRTSRRKRQAGVEEPSVTVQLPLPAIAELEDLRGRFFALCVSAGHQVLTAMMEEERTRLCGPKWSRNGDRWAGRGGTTASQVTLGGRRLSIRRPRVRSREGKEVALPSFEFFSSRDPLNEHTMEAMAAGVSTRSYQGLLDPLPPSEQENGASKSAVSRRFVALTQKLLTQWACRPIDDLDLRVIMIDGIVFRGHCVLIALGIAADGVKHVIGLREGTTENASVAKALIDELIRRGLPTDRALVFVIDGGKGLRKAIGDTFGELGLIQRCQVHKRRNVCEHLPDHMRPKIARAMEEAYDMTDAAAAERKLEQLAKSLERDHPGAAASLREGLAETLTVRRLGVTGVLFKTLRSTNPIENLNGAVAQYTRNVRHWHTGSMILRWVGAAVKEAEKHFNRIRGHTQMDRLIAVLKDHEQKMQLDSEKKVA